MKTLLLIATFALTGCSWLSHKAKKIEAPDDTAKAYKINLNTTHAIETLIYNAIRARNTKSLAEQSTEAVTAVARLLQAKA